MLDSHIAYLTTAIAQLPPAPGEAPAASGNSTGAAPGGAPGTGAGGGGATSPWGGDLMLIFVVVILGMIIFSIMGQRRERKKREAMISAIKKHDRVQTIGGVIGSVVEIKPDYVVLKVDESSNTRITFSRSAIQQVLSSAPGTGGDGEPTS